MKKSTCCGAKVTSRMSYDSNSTYPTCVCNACQKPCEVVEDVDRLHCYETSNCPGKDLPITPQETPTVQTGGT